jgi:hypothetical protein
MGRHPTPDGIWLANGFDSPIVIREDDGKRKEENEKFSSLITWFSLAKPSNR